ncbi:MAG: single-stranded DNA-binding protein [Spirochaetaceae bacterium]|nr:single-stranded DNA-binding protein [Spirochaetaceae bacterium]
MEYINKIEITGRLTRDAEFKQIADEKRFCKLSIAHNHLQDKTSFFDVIAWDDAADCAANGKKGAAVHIKGHIQQNRWIGSDGQARSRVEIRAGIIEFMSDEALVW